VGEKWQSLCEMNVVVDTNIIFSALISAKSIIPEIIFAPYNNFRFYTSEYLFDELEEHKSKLQKASKLTEKEINKAKVELFKYINIISLEIIPIAIWQQAKDLTFDIDPDDIPFVALSIYLDAYLWTGDKTLYNGLQDKGFNKILLTSTMKVMFNPL
jgi:putative PIN family toxin of toxin-antitoxin system